MHGWGRTPSADALVAGLCQMAAALNAPAKLQRTPAQIEAYFEACRAKMRPNPFHNWNHAFDVAQFMFALLTGTGLEQKLCDAQLLGLFFGAVAHDLDHRGRSNAFEINERTELALEFPKSSAPLESHHCALALATMDEVELFGTVYPTHATIRLCVSLCVSLSVLPLIAQSSF